MLCDKVIGGHGKRDLYRLLRFFEVGVKHVRGGGGGGAGGLVVIEITAVGRSAGLEACGIGIHAGIRDWNGTFVSFFPL